MPPDGLFLSQVLLVGETDFPDNSNQGIALPRLTTLHEWEFPSEGVGKISLNDLPPRLQLSG